MKKILAGFALSAMLAAPTMAADMRMPVKAAPAPVITLFSWTGCYIGGHAGYAWGKKRIDFAPNIFGVEYDHDVDGFIAGGQVGCNFWQRDRWVLGIEGQASWADIDGSVGGPDPAITANYGGFRTEADVIGSIAARLGYAFGATGQTLVFVKGGAAFIHERFFTAAVNPAFVTQSDKDLRWGWMVGGGFEQALNSNWSLKAEYNYSNFGTRNVALCNEFGCDDFSIKQHIHLVKVGINYRFGGPVVARY
jgi:outer membrane immunogenic protein